jgi:N-acetylneuraminic acid mutarotase
MHAKQHWKFRGALRDQSTRRLSSRRRRLLLEPLEHRLALAASAMALEPASDTPLELAVTGIPDVIVNEDAADTFIRLREWFADVPGGSVGLTFAVHSIAPVGTTLFSSAALETGMAETRTAHTVTRLPNGKVLAAGGFYYDGSEPIQLNSVELYDPVSATWSIVAPLQVARSEHQAVLLTDGRVLVMGGTTDAGTSASAEIYNPATNTWTLVNPMAVERAEHSATILPSGKVLVVGGLGSDSTTSAELYDPATNMWAGAAPPAVWRRAHSATGLADGSVLIVGGVDKNSEVVATAERYNPAENTWSAAGALGAGRLNHAATLLADGTVLVTGGATAGGAVATVERYTPAANSWTTRAPLIAARQGHSATLLGDGRVLVVGGDPAAGPTVDTAEIYQPLTNVWSQTDAVAKARTEHTATLLLDGTVLITGGLDFAGGFPPDTLSTSELYEPIAGAWGMTAPVLRLSYAKDEFGAADVTIRATDNGGGTLDDTFTVTVNPVNDPPRFEAGVDLAVNDNSGPQSIAAWATQISKGPSNEDSQVLSFVVQVTSNPELFVTPPAIDASGRLTFSPAPNAVGTANITVRLLDDGGTAHGGVDSSSTKSLKITVNKPHKWHNTLYALDVSGPQGVPDSQVVAGDALTIINYINAYGAGPLPALATYGPPYLDTTGDDWVVAGDVLEIINFINAFGAGLPGPAGEAEAKSLAVDAVFQELGNIAKPADVSLWAVLWEVIPISRRKC